MLSSSAFKGVVTLAFFLLIQLAYAAPLSTDYLSPGWSGHERRSTMDASITYPFTSASSTDAGCASSCSLFSMYNATCGSTLYAAECSMCSTGGLDAYVQCANCMVNSTTVTVDQAEIASTLSLMERVCQSYTRTALPSLVLNVEVASTSSAASVLRQPLACHVALASLAVALVAAFL